MATAQLIRFDSETAAQQLRVHLCSVPAGFPSPAEGEEDEPIDLSRWLVEKPAASYLMRVGGHSMTRAGILDQDIIVVSRAERPRDGHIVVAIVHGDRTVKRLERRGERYWLKPEADGYAEFLVDEYVEIWGVVVGVARRLT